MKISIIIPVYNVERYVKRCLESIVAQTYKNWEAIVVNDGSTDSSGEICAAYLEKDKRIKYFSQSNQGLSEARNAGIRLAQGEYICFVDSDDWLEADYVEKMYQSIENDKSDLVVCGYYLSADSNDIKVAVTNKDALLTREDFISRVARNEIESFAWNKLFRLSLIREQCFRKGCLFEDVFFLNDLMYKLRKVSLLHNNLYHYYMREDSIIHIRNFKRETDYFKAYAERYEKDYIKNEDKHNILILLLKSYYYIVQVSINKEEKMYQKYLRKIPKEELKKTKKLLSVKERIRFNLSYQTPKLYRKVVLLIVRSLGEE